MFEVERKARVDHAELRGPLDAAGARSVADVYQRDTYFDHPMRDFAASDEALRLRLERALEGTDAPTARLTYKGPRLDEHGKTRREFETVIAEPDELRSILEALGFEAAGRVEKRRHVYRLDSYRICLDTVSGLGEFVEIEAESTADDIEDASEGVIEVLETLEIPPAATESRTYLEMILAE